MQQDVFGILGNEQRNGQENSASLTLKYGTPHALAFIDRLTMLLTGTDNM